jgi:hypothetical protein
LEVKSALCERVDAMEEELAVRQIPPYALLDCRKEHRVPLHVLSNLLEDVDDRIDIILEAFDNLGDV